MSGDVNYIYLLKVREFIKTNENIFKIGMTKKENYKRFNNYPKGSLLLFQMICHDCRYMEKQILLIFKDEFIPRKDIGSEYFEGDYSVMIDIIYSILKNEHETKYEMHATKNTPYIVNNMVATNKTTPSIDKVKITKTPRIATKTPCIFDKVTTTNNTQHIEKVITPSIKNVITTKTQHIEKVITPSIENVITTKTQHIEKVITPNIEKVITTNTTIIDKKSNSKFYCINCNFNCLIKSDWIKHINRKKHIDNVRLNTMYQANNTICQYCNKIWVTKTSLQNHIRRCKMKDQPIALNTPQSQILTQEVSIQKIDTKDIIIKQLLEQHNMLINQTFELNKKLMDQNETLIKNAKIVNDVQV